MARIEDCAWAAGFFDGEGNIYYSNKDKRRSPRLILQIAQVRRESLDKFRDIFGMSNVSGPYQPKNDKSQPYHTYKVESYDRIRFIATTMWPFMTEPKKEDFTRIFDQYAIFLDNPRCIHDHPLKKGKGNRFFCSTCRSNAAQTALNNRWSKT